MRIAVLGIRGIPSGYSGYETFTQEVGPRLVRRGHEVLVYCRRSLFPERPESYQGIRLIYLPSIQTKSLSTFSHTFVSALDLCFRRADIALYVNVANSPFCLLSKMAGIKTMLNVDGQEWLRPKWGPLGKRYFHAAARLCKHTSHMVVTDAPRMQEIYKDEFKISSVDIAYGANRNEPKKPEALKAYDLEPGKYFFTACRLIPDNNVEVMVQGYGKTKTDMKYVVVGGTPYANPYEETVKAAADRRVQFLGQVEDQGIMNELYANAYAYLHGHEFGGTNPTLLRAMASGLGVVALDTPFNRHTMEDTGYFYSKTPDDAGSAIQAAVDDPEQCRAVGRQLQERVNREYTWDHITDEYEKAFQQLVAT